MNRISTIKKEYLKEEFIKQIGDSYTLNLSVVLLEEFDDLEKENVTLKEEKFKLQARADKYKCRTDKAIEYIEDHTSEHIYNGRDLVYADELLKILKEDNKEVHNENSK